LALLSAPGISGSSKPFMSSWSTLSRSRPARDADVELILGFDRFVPAALLLHRPQL
jgi:hypothetical protein